MERVCFAIYDLKLLFAGKQWGICLLYAEQRGNWIILIILEVNMDSSQMNRDVPQGGKY